MGGGRRTPRTSTGVAEANGPAASSVLTPLPVTIVKIFHFVAIHVSVLKFMTNMTCHPCHASQTCHTTHVDAGVVIIACWHVSTKEPRVNEVNDSLVDEI